MKIVSDKRIEGWESVQHAIKGYISNFKTEESAFFYDQLEALNMIDVLLEHDDSSEAMLDQLGIYTQVLLDNDYHMALPISESLKRLKGYWNEQRIKEAATKTVTTVNLLQESRKEAADRAIADGRLSTPSPGLSTEKPKWEIMQEKSMSELKELAK